MAVGSNKGEITAWRLPKISKPPGLADILALAEQAIHHKDHPVNMRWMFGKPTRSYCLTASATGMGTSEGLLWSFASGEALDEVELWTHMSPDCALIHSMIMAALKPEPGSEPPPHEATQSQPSKEAKPSSGHKTAELNVPGGILKGKLGRTRIDQLLESLAASCQTGRVEIDHKGISAEVLFANGEPVHARIDHLTGNAALIELLGLRHGAFEFRPGPVAQVRTVTKNLEALLFEQNALSNYSSYLKDRKLRDDTPLLRLSPDLSEPDFERLLAAAAPVDMQLQKQIYLSIDGKSTLSDILKRHPLPRSEWIPILFNLIACQLVAVIEIPKIPYLPISAAAIELNKHLLKIMREKVVASQTGLYTYPALLLFLEQELNRFLDCQRPFSLVLIKMDYKDIGKTDLVMQEAAIRALSEPIKKIVELKRRCDLFN